MPRLRVDLDSIRHALLDRALNEVGNAPLAVRLREPARMGRVSIHTDADVSSLVFNGADDRDPEGVFSSDARAHIPYEVQSAWVKTSLHARATGKLALGAPSASVSRNVRLSDYRMYPATEGAVRAIRRNLETFRALNRLDDVRRLRPGEALSLELEGHASFAVRLSWADVLASRLYAILAAVGLEGPAAVKVRADANAEALVRVRDQFSVVVSRDRIGRFRFTVKKNASENHAMSLELGIAADANVVPVVEDAVEPLFEAITGLALRKAESLAIRVGIDRLSADERDLVAELARRLGVATGADRSRGLLDAIGKLRTALRRELEKALRWKAAVGFAYEYARVDEDGAVADYVLLDQSLLARDHAAAIAGDFTHIAAALRGPQSARSIVSYLNETALTRSSSSGFSLGIGKWVDVRARDENSFRRTIRRSLDGFQLVTCRATRKYSEQQIPENDFEWIVDLKAQMNEYREEAEGRDFDFGLHYSVILERDALDRDDLERMVDFGAMWGVRIPSPELGTTLGTKATIRVELLFEGEDLRRILPASDQGDWAEALAAAMPYMAGFEERRSFRARKQVYTPAWQEWLRGASHPAGEWAAMLRPRINSSLRTLEDRGLPGSFAWTSGEGHAHLRDRLESFCQGMRRLGAVMRSEASVDTIAEAWEGMQRGWGQRLTLAASGNVLLAAARQAGVLVHRSMRVDSGEHVIVI